MTTRPFRIVTHKNWLAEQFAPAGAVQDFGLDIDPATAADTIWWAPGAWAASALKAGVRLPLMSCGPHWLGGLSHQFVGRRVATGRLDRVGVHDNLRCFGDRVFVKLPEAKVESVPAQVFTNNRWLHDTLSQFHLPPDTLVQIQDVVEFHTEMRCFIAHREVVASSFYRIGNRIWGQEDFAGIAELPSMTHYRTVLLRFAREVAAAAPGPTGYVLDVGLVSDEEHDQALVVEANAAWSSGPYDCDPTGVLEAITAAHDFDGEHPEWAWEPNPVLHGAGPLRLRTEAPGDVGA